MIGIYKITSPSNRIYIGQSINIENRKRIYKYYNSYKNCIGPKIYNSLQKYGFENHKFDIIEECLHEELNNQETYWKQHYLNQVNEDWQQVLFCGLYDKGKGSLTQETKDKISKSKLGTNGFPKGIKRPKEFGENISNNINRGNKISQSLIANTDRNIKISESRKGQLLSQETKDKISKNNKGITRNQKSVIQLDKQGNFIKKWSSQTEAGLNLNIRQGDINSVVHNKQKSAGGYIWKNVENFKFG